MKDYPYFAYLTILLSICCLLLSACSMPQYTASIPENQEEQSGGQLVNIRIERWGTLLFSGLLAMKKQQSGLHYAMMDSSGIKLLEAEVNTTGEHTLLHAKTGIKESKLPEYLSTSLRRIYLLKPSELPCTASLLMNFCIDQPGNQTTAFQKSLHAGPIALWKVETGTVGERGAITLYSQPWVGVRIYLEDFQN
ncbi:hypothetical protein [Desulfosediminicola flagellatus]|uniref:hypothetical protein n=1 Tax=Desulfosediminicola flagellatus TaxID=2569541 RepID=UPI0010ABE78A|nr:hypothetical protein [Desulfosediminicola flagellatus]